MRARNLGVHRGCQVNSPLPVRGMFSYLKKQRGGGGFVRYGNILYFPLQLIFEVAEKSGKKGKGDFLWGV